MGLYPDAMVEWWPYIDQVPWLQGRDLILMDQREAGLAEPSLDCPEIEQTGIQLLKLSADPMRRRALYVAAAEACRQRWVGAGYNLGDFDSTATAADFAELRIALGIEAWNLYGVSYGTQLALMLMRDHPEGVRSFSILFTRPSTTFSRVSVQRSRVSSMQSSPRVLQMRPVARPFPT